MRLFSVLTILCPSFLPFSVFSGLNTHSRKCKCIPFFAGHHSATATTSEEAEKSESLVRSKRKTDRLTAYACEDTTLNITCGPDLYLDVIRANYGRFSITICNDHGNTDWKVDCQAGRTLRAMQARCSNKKQCIVPVQSSIFGDPCPGTYKYIEVHYACRKGNTCNTLHVLGTVLITQDPYHTFFGP